MQWVSLCFILRNAYEHLVIEWSNRWIHIFCFLPSCLFFTADYVPCIGGEVWCRGWAFVYWDHVLQQLFVSSIFVIPHYSYRGIPKFFIIIICKGQFLSNPFNFCQKFISLFKYNSSLGEMLDCWRGFSLNLCQYCHTMHSVLPFL